jgi:hypothetical protein
LRSDPDLVEEQSTNARAASEEYLTKDHSIDRYYRLLTGEQIEADVTQSQSETTQSNP